jgi:hypothetical protein
LFDFFFVTGTAILTSAGFGFSNVILKLMFLDLTIAAFAARLIGLSVVTALFYIGANF